MKHIREYSIFESSIKELTQDQKDWLDRCSSLKWELNLSSGLVDVHGDFDCSGQNLKDFKGIRFGKVKGMFYCPHNLLTTLEGSPSEVEEFICSHNELSTLKGGPERIMYLGFHCTNNRLTDLEGSPREVGGDFYCNSNNLTSLKGGPISVGRDFHCQDNFLTDLQGSPDKIWGYLYCFKNDLTTLEGSPEEVGTLDCSDNSLTDLKGCPIRIRKTFRCSNNDIVSLQGAPQECGYYDFSGNPVSGNTLESIYRLMLTHESYTEALKEYWPKMNDHERALMHEGMPDLPDKEKKIYSALFRNIKRSDFF